MKADKQTEAEIKEVLDKMSEDYKKGNIDEVLTLFAPDPDVVLIGSGTDEKRIGLDEIRTQVERDIAQTESRSMEHRIISISSAGSISWCATESIVHATVSGQEITFDGRSTVVLEKRGDKWLIVQMHFSTPLSGQAEGESWPTN